MAKRRGIVSADAETHSGRRTAQKQLMLLVGREAAKYDCGLAVELAVAGLGGSYGESDYHRQGIKAVAEYLGVPMGDEPGGEAESADNRTPEQTELAA